MTYYLQVLANQSPFPIGQDDQRRYMFSVNFRVTAETPIINFEMEIVKLLTDAGLVVYEVNPNGTVSAATSIAIGSGSVIPDNPTPFMLLRATGGAGPEETHDGKKYENRSFQIVVYGPYFAARDKIDQICQELDGKREFEIAAA